jgi:hypothetical protein
MTRCENVFTSGHSVCHLRLQLLVVSSAFTGSCCGLSMSFAFTGPCCCGLGMSSAFTGSCCGLSMSSAFTGSCCGLSMSFNLRLQVLVVDSSLEKLRMTTVE